MLKDNSQEILDTNYFLNKRKDAKKKTKFIASKHRFFLVGILIGICILVGIYFFTGYSNVYHVTVDGNIYYSDEKIKELSGIDDGDKFLFVSSKKAKKSLMADGLIKDVAVKKLDHNVINITVEEYKIIGYIYEDNNPRYLLINDDRLEINEENMSLIYKVPLIEGYDKEGLKKIEKGFTNVEIDVIEEISEIHRYPFSYDEYTMEVIMKDGNYLFLSTTGMKMITLNSYYSVISELNLGRNNACLYLEEIHENLQYRKCPWEKTEIVIVDDSQ